MGRKSKFKKIRRAASQLPVINVKTIKAEKVSGLDLIHEGLKEVDGKPIDAELNYKKKTIVPQPLNHNRKMKRMYNKYGFVGVNHYLESVANFINNSKTKQNEKTSHSD